MNDKELTKRVQEAVEELERLKASDPQRYAAYLSETLPVLEEIVGILERAKARADVAS